MIKDCIVCGTEFEVKSSANTCNPDCFKEKKRAGGRKYYHKNTEKYSEYRSLNSDKVAAYKKEWYQKNKDTRRTVKYKARENHYTAKRRAAKLKATPSWLLDTHLKEIELFYHISKWYKEETHVDHIVPLQGKNVCGLHVPWNLQIIPAKDNLIKGNKF